eukprot:5538175-Prymnesium_polylepis.1
MSVISISIASIIGRSNGARGIPAEAPVPAGSFYFPPVGDCGARASPRLFLQECEDNSRGRKEMCYYDCTTNRQTGTMANVCALALVVTA